MMEGRGEVCPANRVSDAMLECIFSHLDTPGDRNAVSEVCRQWKRVDSMGRKDVRIGNCYSVAPDAVSRRFPHLDSLYIRGKSRAADFGLVVENWGGYFRPWVEELAKAYGQKVKKLCLRRMHVTDEDLRQLAESFSGSLIILKLHKCFGGFSTLGLLHITSHCRLLKVLHMEESEIKASKGGGEWVKELAQTNHDLEELNFQYVVNTDPDEPLVEVEDLETLVNNCKSLRSLKVSEEVQFKDMQPILSRATALRELGMGSAPPEEQDIADGGQNLGRPAEVDFPRSIVALSGLYNFTDFSLTFPSAMLAGLKVLNLKYSNLSEEGHIDILTHCVGLERLEVTNVLGDQGLITVSETCKDLKWIQIEDDHTGEGRGFISPAGIIPFLQGCTKLEHLVMYVGDLNNDTLTAVAEHCPFMTDCRFVLLSLLAEIADLPLDEGVKSLLSGCQHLRRFALYVRKGALTDVGMAYIGMYGSRLKWILLGCAGNSDDGLKILADGCTSLQKLEMRDCPVSELGLARAAQTNQKLKFIWAQGYAAAQGGGQILAQSRTNWVVETCTSTGVGTITAYCSLTSPRVDNPPEISIVVSDGSNLSNLVNGRSF